MSDKPNALKKVEKGELIEEKNKDLVEKDKKNQLKKADNKSVQNKIINNIKSFISKIIDMQEKVKKDEEESKKIQQAEKEEEKKETLNEEKETKRDYLLEYYDLPYRYNETVVKILAQTPKRLFVYWDISDRDKEMYLKAFGENFFYDTYPVLLLHNENKDYTTEIAINDFANSWYIEINDPRDKYTIQLGRKFKKFVKPCIDSQIESAVMENIHLNNDFLFIATSNKLEVPNDHILFEEFKPYVTYRNVKTLHEKTKEIISTTFADKLRELYGKLYNTSLENGKFDMLNPSSNGLGSSGNVKFG